MSKLADQMTPEALQNNMQAALQTTDSLLDQFQAMHLSLTELTVGGLLCLFVLVIATREAFGWFSKADKMRREIRRLQKTSSEIEVEVKAIKDLLIQLQGSVRSRMDSSSGNFTRSNSSHRDQTEIQKLDQDPAPTTVPTPIPNSTPPQTDDLNRNFEKEPKRESSDSSLDREIDRKKVFKSSTQAGEALESKQFPIIH